MQHGNFSSGPDRAFEADLAAYNLAFSELGLEWHWDAATYDQIRRVAGDRPCVEAYVEAECPHLLQAYDSRFLAEAVESVRARRSSRATG
jgi:hypothetical protein